MGSKNESISKVLVKFLSVVKKHISERNQHIHYKLCAEIKTPAGKEKQEFWYVENSLFLRQKDSSAKTLRIGFNDKQRSQIVALVKKFEKKSKAS